MASAPTQAEAFLLHPKNADFAAGRSRLRYPVSSAGCFLPVGLLFILAGLVFASFILREVYFYVRLEWVDGREVQGTVLFTKDTSDSDGSSYRAAFTYIPEGATEPLKGDHQIFEQTFRRLREGDPVTVIYSVGAPTISRIDGATWQSPLMMLLAGGFILVWMSIPAWLVWMGLKEMWLRRLLKANGRIVPGQIVYASSRLDTDGDFVLTIRFEFTAPTGRVAQGEESARREDLRDADLPRIGARVLVYTADENSYALL